MKYDFSREWTSKECEKFVNKYHDDLVEYVKFLRGEAVIVDKEKIIRVSNPLKENEDSDKLDTSCLGAVLSLVSALTKNSDVHVNVKTAYLLAEMLGISMSLDKFVEMGLMEKRSNGYRIKSGQIEAFKKLAGEEHE